MAGLNDVNSLAREMERIMRGVEGKMAEFREAEYVGTAADDLVTATLVGGELTVDIHLVAKRRMEPDELGAAVVEAVNNAEAQATGAMSAFLDDGAGLSGNDEFHAQIKDAMRQLRPPGL